MRVAKLFSAALVIAAATLVVPAHVEAQARRAGPAIRRAVPRASAPVPVRPIGPRFVAPFRPFYYPYYGYPFYGSGFSLGFYTGYPYGYFGYGYPYAYGYPFGYPYGYPYDVVGYGGAANAYGGVRIQGAPRDAQVYVDGYYVGIVDDFDGVYQHVNLTPGAHKIEIRPNGAPPISVDVQIQPGQTITYRADLPRSN